MVNLTTRIADYLDGLPGDRRRVLKPSAGLPGGLVQRDGRELVNFASNDYLGLAYHPLLAERAAAWAQRYGAGLGASRLVTGNHQIYQQVEEKLAALKGTESALLLNSGFQANASVLAALLDRRLHGGTRAPEVLLYCDKLNHASLHFGVQAAGARQIRFRHNDLAHLERLLEQDREKDAARIIVTESVFSMDGDRLDVGAMRALAKHYDAFLYVDEAHATGVLGKDGMGLCARGHRTETVGETELVLGTFGKGLGCYGAYVACSQALRDYLINACAGLIYATALPPQVLGSIDAALDLVPDMEEERRHVASLSERLRQALNGAGFDTLQSSTQIVPVVIGEDSAVLSLAGKLEEEGYLVGAIRPPTVPQGSGRLRITLSAAHSEVQVDGLIAALLKHAPKRSSSERGGA